MDSLQAKLNIGPFKFHLAFMYESILVQNNRQEKRTQAIPEIPIHEQTLLNTVVL